jgi:hypothetical protein
VRCDGERWSELGELEVRIDGGRKVRELVLRRDGVWKGFVVN